MQYDSVCCKWYSERPLPRATRTRIVRKEKDSSDSGDETLSYWRNGKGPERRYCSMEGSKLGIIADN